jgi:hypothetical protein
MADSPDMFSFLGHDLVDQSGERLGRIEGFYLDEVDEPQWVAVALAAGGAERVVPLEGAEQAGAELQIKYTKDVVMSAPVADLSKSETWPSGVVQHFGVYAQGPPKRWP